MAGFESFKKGKRSSDRGSSRGRSRDSGRSSGRGSSFSGRDKPIERTTVTCSACGKKCEVPFKPTSNKPIYCDDCFVKPGRDSKPNKTSAPTKISEADLDIINEKLNKIMKHLKIK